MTLMDTPIDTASPYTAVPPAPKPGRRSPDVFTFDEAAAYLALSYTSFRLLRNQMRHAGVPIGHRRNRAWLFCTEELEAARKFMFGLDGPKRRK